MNVGVTDVRRASVVTQEASTAAPAPQVSAGGLPGSSSATAATRPGTALHQTLFPSSPAVPSIPAASSSHSSAMTTVSAVRAVRRDSRERGV